MTWNGWSTPRRHLAKPEIENPRLLGPAIRHRLSPSPTTGCKHFTTGQVTFTYKDYKHEQRHKVMTISADEFLRRFLLHVLPDSFQRIRHYGLLGNRYRAANLARCRELLAIPMPMPIPQPEPDCRERCATTHRARSVRGAQSAVAAGWCGLRFLLSPFAGSSNRAIPP